MSTGPAQAPVPAAPLRWLDVRHETRYDHASAVELAHHLAHLRPRDTPHQRVAGWRLDVEPPPDGGVGGDLDAWGNWRHVFSHATVHAQLTVVSQFRAGVRQGNPLRAGGLPWEKVAAQLQYQGGALAATAAPAATEFALSSPYAARSAVLAAFARESFTPGRPIADAAWDLNRRVHEHFEYRSGATSVGTSAAAAFSQRQGVCQDYAHVMIAALRSIGLAARYVSGYLLTTPPPGQPRLLGADASHAWLEVWMGREADESPGGAVAEAKAPGAGSDDEEGGWWALDPTNAIACGADHVTVAWGRDYGDVAPLRGVVRGGAGAAPQVSVSVVPIEEGAPPPRA